MSQVLWHITMSLDGFIASPGNDMNWMADYIEADPVVDEILANIGALIVGRRTYEQARTEAGRPYGGMWTGPMFVPTRDSADDPAPGFVFVPDDIGTAVTRAKAAAGDKYVVVLGAKTAARCLDAGLLDEILVHSVPLLLGDGVRMFERPRGARVKLERIRLASTAHLTDLWFRVVR